MDIKENIHESQSSFFIEQDGIRDAEIVFHLDQDNTMIIEHTEVAEKLAGKGIGQRLVTHAVEYARKKHLAVIPRCTYAAKLFHKKGEEWADVLKK